MSKVKEVARNPGWVDGDAADFLGLSEAESLLIDLKITTSMAIRRLRAGRKMTQEISPPWPAWINRGWRKSRTARPG